MRTFRSSAIALTLVLVLVTPVAAYVLWAYYVTSAIDTNLDSEADLSVCYSTSSNNAMYINRGQVSEEIGRWHQASVGAFSSLGLCNDDGSNIEMLWRSDLGSCSPVTGGTYAVTNNPGNVGVAQRQVWFNTNCLPHFDWYDNDGIDPGKISALALALHEVGHALGLHHSQVANAVMNAGGPDNCSIVGNDFTLAFDDADGYRDRYPGIDNTTTAFGPNAGCVN